MKRILIAILMAQLFFSLQTMAQGDLLVTPSRVVFEGTKQKEQLNLLNMGQDTATYTISFVQRRMKEDGSLLPLSNLIQGRCFQTPICVYFPVRLHWHPVNHRSSWYNTGEKPI